MMRIMNEYKVFGLNKKGLHLTHSEWWKTASRSRFEENVTNSSNVLSFEVFLEHLNENSGVFSE